MQEFRGGKTPCETNYLVSSAVSVSTAASATTSAVSTSAGTSATATSATCSETAVSATTSGVRSGVEVMPSP